MWSNLGKSLLAVVLGNASYFLLMPHLPQAAQHQPNRLDLGLLVDFWVCLVVWGVIAAAARKRRTR